MVEKHEKKQEGSASAASRRQPAAAFRGASKLLGQGTKSDTLYEVLTLFQDMRSSPSRGDNRYTFSEKVKKYISEVPTESISRLRVFASFMKEKPYAVSHALVEICNDKKQEMAVRIDALVLLSKEESIGLITATSEADGIGLLEPMKLILRNHQVLIAMSKVNDISFNPNLIEGMANHLFQKRQKLLLTPEGLELLPYAIALSSDEKDGSSFAPKYLFLINEVSTLPSKAKREILSGVELLSTNSFRIREYAAELLVEMGSPSSIPPTEHAGSLA